MSEDPKHFRGGDFNLYRYVDNQPLISKDPYGENKWLIAAALCAAATYYAINEGVRRERKDQCSMSQDSNQQRVCKENADNNGIDENFQDMSDDSTKAFTE